MSHFHLSLHRAIRSKFSSYYSVPPRVRFRSNWPAKKRKMTGSGGSSGSNAVSPSKSSTAPDRYTPRYVDIGINLTDKMYKGQYHGKKLHEEDLDDVVQRAVAAGCKKMMVTGSDLHESLEAVSLAKRFPGLLYATCGVHPCCAMKFDTYPGGPEKYLADLKALAQEGKKTGHIVAFGEIGLDYDRLMLCPMPEQKKYFELQLDLAIEIGLPLFLHSRAASSDFESYLLPRLSHLKGGLVHSFTGTLGEMKRLVDAGLYIGVNGCSLKTEENLEVVRHIPLGRMLLETDGPWCEIRKSHASYKYLKDAPELPKSKRKEKWEKGYMVNSRNEPVAISHVAHVVARLKELPVDEICEVTWRNSIDLFGLGETDA